MEYGEVLEDAIHHVFLGEMLEFVDEIDHVLAHGRAVDAVDEASVLEARVLGLHLLDDLFAERAHFRRTGDGHVLIALVSSQTIRISQSNNQSRENASPACHPIVRNVHYSLLITHYSLLLALHVC